MWLFSSRKARRTAQPVRPFLELLENRTVPASLSYSTYFNGTIYATAVDSAGNVYVTGNTGSGLATTPGAFQTTGSGAFVAKLNATGTALLYATYLGNGGYEGGTGIAVDAAGDAYVIGENLNVPTTPNAIASSASGYNNIFVAELNPTGSGLIYSTYLPGAIDTSYGSLGLTDAIAVDGSGNIYVAGAAEAGLPVTAGAFQTAYLGPSGASNAFFAKINPALSGTASVLYATYLGGTVWDAASGIALDGSGNAYLEGFTYSSNFPTTSGAFQKTLGGQSNAFVAKFNPALSGAASLLYSTYLGGSGNTGYVSASPPFNFNLNEIDGGIAVDSAGNAYVTSGTQSLNFPTTPGAYQVTSKLVNNNDPDYNGSDAFVTKLNATGTALIYSTYLGGGGSKKSGVGGTRSGGASIAVDSNGDAHVTGWTNSTVFPTKNALQTTNAGGFDAFVTVLNPSGSGLLFSSYFGGSSDDFGYGIALDAAGNAYVGGQTSSSNFPTTAGAYQKTAGSGFVLKIDPPADASEVSVPIDGTPAVGAGAFSSVSNDFLLVGYPPSAAQIGSFTVNPNLVLSGSNVTLTAANIALADPSSTITQVAIYVQIGGTNTLLGYGTQTSPGVWTFTFTVNLTPGTYTLFAQAQDSDGVFSDPLALLFQVQ
jgi:hypothetical protein